MEIRGTAIAGELGRYCASVSLLKPSIRSKNHPFVADK